MFDTINFSLAHDEAGGVDLLSEIPCYLDNVGEHYYNGVPYISGNANGLRVKVSEYKVSVGDGSLCKFYLGDNYQTMNRRDTQRAIEQLSDLLHLPMSNAQVTRLDIAQNFIVQHPPTVYINHLGQLANATRLVEPSGLYYKTGGGVICFYDKNKEQKSKHEQIPELYKGRNVLRYEQRYQNRIASRLGVNAVTGGLLYDEKFYISLVDGWANTYNKIKKIGDINLNWCRMTTKKDLGKMGVLSLVERVGGQMEMRKQIDEAQQRGELTKKQAFDLRKAVDEACKVQNGLVVPNDAIQELDKKIIEAVRFYR